MNSSQNILGPIVHGGDLVPPPVIILIYEGWDMAIGALALHYEHYPNIWVVDNHSPNDRGSQLQERFPKVRLFRTATNGGWAYAYNRAIAQAMAEGYRSAYLLNSDAAPTRGSVEAALLALEAAPRAAAVGSHVLAWDGETVEYDGVLYPPGEGPKKADYTATLEPVTRVHGAGMAISFAAFQEIGSFHEEYFLYHEETDWLIRALEGGWTLLADGKSTIRHMAGKSMIGANAHYFRSRNHLLAFKRGILLGGETENFWSVLWAEADKLYQTDCEIRFAVRQGIVDGLWGRSGPRPLAANRLLIWLQTVPIRAAMKVRSLIRLKTD